MKTLQYFSFLFLLLLANETNAQVSVNINVGGRPDWGLAGFRNVNYYYLPDIQTYYDLKTSNFIYIKNGRWTRSRNLPIRYRNYDLYNGYKVVITDYNGNRPYNYFNRHRVKYHRGNPKNVIIQEVRHKKQKTYRHDKIKNRDRND
ncbi:hypothetical protein GV828_08005 [Flavobacterium sp. NST-5]|uniref:Uncharacterized protein n=1 Tax=Flavobacterium ichthyis TaxID=2698827 RepID=A0ABW9Z8X9_9FLAO|nr:hypothetical protein [Flavobacterium ichthyis]NBL65139.1 hypothetical protein [Flavobacterium ichthyis]